MNDKLLQVVRGSYSLLPYSVDFWLEHLFDYVKAISITQDSPLGILLASFHSSHSQTALKLKRSLSNGIPSRFSTDARLAALSHLAVGSICASILTFREECRDKFAGTGEGKVVPKDYS